MVPQSYFDLSPKSNFIGHLRLSGLMLSNLQKDFQWIKVNYSFVPILFLLFQKFCFSCFKNQNLYENIIYYFVSHLKMYKFLKLSIENWISKLIKV